MKVLVFVFLASVLPAGFAFAAADETSRNGASTRESYRVVHGWPQLPDGRVLGSVSGVGIDNQGNVFVFHRNERAWPESDELTTTPITGPTVTLFDAHTGKVLAEWGENVFAMPHGLTVDHENNVWLTDVALHQVYKFTHEGKLLMTLGERGVSGDDATHFNRPTDVAVAADGTVFVSDGYRNARVVEFSRDGAFVSQWGVKGAGPGEFNVPHGLAIDEIDQLYVADRENDRVQVFDRAGHFVAQWKGSDIGRPYGIAIARNKRALVADGGEQPANPPDRSGVSVLKLDGTVIGRFGRWGNYDGQFRMAHDVAVALDGAVYVGDITGARVQKFVAEK